MGLLVIGCANVSSLLLARGLSRRRDHAIRIATGASDGRLLRQSFLEALLLSLLGSTLGLVFSTGTVRFLRESLSATALWIPDKAHTRIDFRLFAFSFVISIVAALASAGFPAWTASSRPFGERVRAVRKRPRDIACGT